MKINSEEKTKEAMKPVFRSRDERIAAGKALRERVPHQSHADWTASMNRRDPIEVLRQSNEDRLPELILAASLRLVSTTEGGRVLSRFTILD